MRTIDALDSSLGIKCTLDSIWSIEEYIFHEIEWPGVYNEQLIQDL